MSWLNLISGVIIVAIFLTSCSGINAIYPTATITETVTQKVYSELSYFNNYGELSGWLDSIRGEMKNYRQPEHNCVDYSWWLINRAKQDGYFIVFHPINPEQYNNSFTELQLDGGHAITATYINNKTYLIEPQNFEVFPKGDY